MFPGDGCFLNAKLGIPGVPALDVRNQCSGFLYGLSVADAWIRTGTYKRILLVGSETHSTGLDVSTRGRDVSVIFGDGAAAALLEATDDPGRGVLGDRAARRRALRHRPLDRRPGLHLQPAQQPRAWSTTAAGSPRWRGRRSSSTPSSACPRRCAACSGRPASPPPTSRSSCPHQANLRIAETVQKSLGLRDDQVFNNIQKYGNTTAASIPLALSEAIPARGVKRGRPGGLAAFGAGFTWGAALARW